MKVVPSKLPALKHLCLLVLSGLIVSWMISSYAEFCKIIYWIFSGCQIEQKEIETLEIELKEKVASLSRIKEELETTQVWFILSQLWTYVEIMLKLCSEQSSIECHKNQTQSNCISLSEERKIHRVAIESSK